MTNIERAINDALEGGWNEAAMWGFRVDESQKPTYKNSVVVCGSFGDPAYELSINETMLDPLFWQALQKTNGWKYSNYAEKFDHMFPAKYFTGVGIPRDIKSFIETEITKAREEERERILELLKENFSQEFRDIITDTN